MLNRIAVVFMHLFSCLFRFLRNYDCVTAFHWWALFYCPYCRYHLL